MHVCKEFDVLNVHGLIRWLFNLNKDKANA